MHLSTLLVALGVGVLAAPLDPQKPLAATRGHAGPHKVADPYKPGVTDPYDNKIDSQADKLTPLPYVCIQRESWS